MTAKAETYPRVIAAIPDDGMYLVALDATWGRILNTEQRMYYPTVRIGTALVMTGPWEDAEVPTDTLAEWIAAAHDGEADLSAEQRARIEQQRQRMAGSRV